MAVRGSEYNSGEWSNYSCSTNTFVGGSSGDSMYSRRIQVVMMGNSSIRLAPYRGIVRGTSITWEEEKDNNNKTHRVIGLVV